MKKWLFLCAVLLVSLAFLTAVASEVYAKEKLQIVGVDDDSDLGEWLEEAIINRFDEDEEWADPLDIEIDTVRAMEAKGYYETKVQVAIPENEEDPPIVTIKKGPRYTISSISIKGINGFEVRTLEVGEPLDAFSVLETQRNLAEDIQTKRCAFNLALEHQVILDKKKNTGAVTYNVEAGAKAKFGEVSFEGAPNIDREHLYRFLAFKKGECWSQKKIEDTKEKLLGTGLIALIKENIPEKPAADGSVDIMFELAERAPRSIRFGLSFYTDEGPGAVAEWEHRNFHGSGEKLSAALRVNMIEQSLGAEYSKPFFLDDEDKALNLAAKLAREETDAYIDRGLELSASVDNRFNKYLKGSLGVALETTSQIDKNDNNNETTFGLFSTPISLTFDNRDSPLNPTRGFWARARAEPYFDVLGQADPFFKTSLAASTYFPLTSDRDLILALRGRLGSILGSGTTDVPSNKRFYAGGGGSIRGFGYQEAGPMVNGDPAGGRSVVETSAELRYRYSETMGGVIFVDGGGAYDEVWPDFKDGYYIGAGVGFRYYTGFGPLRFDVAVPVNKRDQASAAFQVYVSIGQAF